MAEHASRRSGNGAGGGSGIDPGSLIHRRILAEAERNPDASFEALADEVEDASLTFVERILEKHGDPAHPDAGAAVRREDDCETGERVGQDGQSRESTVDRSGGPAESESVGSSREDAAGLQEGGSREADPERPADGGTAGPEPAEQQRVTDSSQLSERERETLIAVADRPTATQAEIGSALGVSRATVSKRLSGIPGFEWSTRQEFVRSMFDYRGGSSEPTGAVHLDGGPNGESAGQPDTDRRQSDTDGGSAAGAGQDPLEERVSELEARLEALEASVDDAAGRRSGNEGPELVCKVVHACMDAEYVSKEEELAVVWRLLE